MARRPWCCPEPRCVPIFNVGGRPDVSLQVPGESIFCWGAMDRPIEFVYDGIEHSNDRNFCVETPLKGTVRFQVNEGDLGILATGMKLALDPDFVAKAIAS